MAMAEQTYLQLEYTVGFDRLTVFIGSATLFTYLLQRQIALWKVGEMPATSLLQYLTNHRLLVFTLLGISGAGMAYGFSGIDSTLYPLMGFIGLISLAYDIPIGNRRLRTTGILKVFLIAFVWGAVTVLLPAVHAGESLQSANVWMLMVQRSLFILAITLPFDLRDVLIDREVQMETVPARIGHKATISLSVWLLAGVWLLEVVRIFFFHHTALLLWQPLVGLSVALVGTAWIIYRKPTVDDDVYFFGMLDGSMLVQFLLIWLSVTLLPAVPW